MSKRYTRRGFIIGTAATASGLIAGCAGLDGEDGKDGKDAVADDSGVNIEWDEEIDVLVVGSGGAGLVAAIEAASAGASVIILEKRDTIGGSTGFSGGVVQASGTKYQDQFGIIGDSADLHFQYWQQAGEGAVDEELVRLMADNSADDLEWYGSLGASFDEIYGVDPIPYIDSSVMLDRLHVTVGKGGGYIENLEMEATNQGVEIRLESPMLSLVYNAQHGVLGVVASIGGKDTNIRAKRAVVMASGGYDRNLDMALAYCPQLYYDLQNNFCLASDANTGDGIKAGMAIGADLAGMGSTISYPNIRVGRAEGGQEIPGIWVNKYGQRFANEATHYGYITRAVFDQEQHVVWAVFDESVKEMGGSTIGGWSEDLSDEIADGKILTADTVAELAQKMSVNQGQLELTLGKWNDDMNGGGQDTLFEKQVGLSAMETAPYYAVRVKAYNIGSCGGLKIDTQTRVVDIDGEPIPRLYAAGMVSGGFIGPYYPGSGTAVCATLVFGRIAGKNAAAETPQE